MFSTLDTKKANALSLVRHGWLSPRYELTDNGYVYGEMAYNGFSRWIAKIKAADGGFKLSGISALARTINITDDNGALIGSAKRAWLSQKVTLTLQTGFTAEFYRESIFSREYTWSANGCGEIMQIHSSIFSRTDNIHIGNSMAPQPVIPLLIFLGKHLIILRRRRKAAR
ncbi:MAG: hypothetical protein V4577_23925 [Bacteroidota bacterium]